MKLACHQPNFIPWFPFFDKMNKADIFIIMINCQYEKNGFQNRAKVFDKWWTLPVKRGKQLIKNKKYMNGAALNETNLMWILAMAKTLGIDTSKIHMDFETEKDGTERIIELCKKFKCDQYLSNPDAFEKYLDHDKLVDNKIDFLSCTTTHKRHVFELFNERGVEGTVKLLAWEKKQFYAKTEKP